MNVCFSPGGVSDAPLERRERESCGHRLRIDLDRLLERGASLLSLALRKLEPGQIRVAAGIRRIDGDGLLDLGDGAVEILQSRQRVAQNEEGLHVPRISREHSLHARLRVFELTGQQQIGGRLELCVEVVRQQVGRPDLFGERRRGRSRQNAYASASFCRASPNRGSALTALRYSTMASAYFFWSKYWLPFSNARSFSASGSEHAAARHGQNRDTTDDDISHVHVRDLAAFSLRSTPAPVGRRRQPGTRD